LKRHLVWIHHAKVANSEVAHCPGGCADVKGIARFHQHDAQMIEFGGSRQAFFILRQAQRIGPHAFRDVWNAIAAGIRPLQAFCRIPFLHGREDVKNLSNLCHKAENGQRRCKLHL
jgi:hypothetical protein